MAAYPSHRLVLTFLAATLLLSTAAFSQLADGGARTIGLARAATALEGEAWGHYNPASWATLSTASVALLAGQPFGMPELRLISAAGAYPMEIGTVGAAVRTYGFEDYREVGLMVGFAREVRLSPTRGISIGGQAAYITAAIPGYESHGTWTVSVGAIVDVVAGLRAGLHARNLNRSGERLTDPLTATPAMAAGLAYRPARNVLVVADVEKSLDGFPVEARAGAEFFVIDMLAVRLGAASEPQRLAGGLGLVLDQIRVDIAAEYHNALGLTPVVEVRLEL